MSQPLKHLWNSISFRLTLNYGLLATLTTLILIAFISVQFLDALRAEYTRQVDATAQRLVVAYEDGGRDALIAAIDLTLSDRIDADRKVYLLQDENGRKLTGNLDPAGAVASLTPTHRHLNSQRLSGGETLVIGHPSTEISNIASLIGKAAAAAILLAVILVLFGTILFRRELAHRVNHIRRITQKIGAGQLSNRIPAATGDDEFTLLSGDINMMLDRIELLMKSARHISDTIAHNLRTPLTRTVGALREAQQPGTPQAAVLEANRQAIRNIETLNVLLEKLLQIAEMEAGIQRRTFKRCDLGVIVKDVIEMYETLAEDKGKTLQCTTLENITLHGDANLIASALANLVDNAVKYGSRDVRVAVTRLGSTARIVIEDDGAGIDAAEHEHLGKHFYRSDPSSEGHGLGLTSVMSIVGLHCGTLAFSDARPGLRVIVSLPINPQA